MNFSACLFQMLAFIKQNEIVLFATLLGTLAILFYAQTQDQPGAAAPPSAMTTDPTNSSSTSNGSFINNVLGTPARMLSSLRGVIRTDSYIKKRREESRMNQEFRTVEQTNKNASYFLRAVRKNDVQLLETLRPLVDESLDIDLALRQAVLSDSLDSVVFLCRKMKTSVNAENSYALRWSVRKGNYRMTEFLMSVGAHMDVENGYSILQDAVLHRFTDIAELLQAYLPSEMFTDPDYPRDKLPSVYERVLCAVQEQHVETLHTLYGGGCRLNFCGNLPWRLAACLHRAIDLIVFFHDIAHFDLDMCDGMLLLNAIRRDDIDTVSYCISHGAQITNQALRVANTLSNRRMLDLFATHGHHEQLLGGDDGKENNLAGDLDGFLGQNDADLSMSFDVHEASFFSSRDGDVSGFMPINLSKELNSYSKTPPLSRKRKSAKVRRRSMEEDSVFNSPAGQQELRYGVITRSRRKMLENLGDLTAGVLPSQHLFR